MPNACQANCGKEDIEQVTTKTPPRLITSTGNQKRVVSEAANVNSNGQDLAGNPDVKTDIQNHSLSAATVQHSHFTESCAPVKEGVVVKSLKHENVSHPKEEEEVYQQGGACLEKSNDACRADCEPPSGNDTASSPLKQKTALQPTSEEKRHQQQKRAMSDNNICRSEDSEPDNKRTIVDDSVSFLNQDAVRQSREERKKERTIRKEQAKNDEVRCEECELVPHPTSLQCCICVNCKTEKVHQKRGRYMQQRKIYQQKLNLVKVVARLDPASHALVKSIREEFQIESEDSRCGGEHIVLAGSLTREKALEMRNHLCDGSLGFTVGRVSGFKVYAKCTYLFLELTATDLALKSTLENDRRKLCMLPQWRLSLVLGFVPKLNAESTIKALNNRFTDNVGRAIALTSMGVDILDSSCESTIPLRMIAKKEQPTPSLPRCEDCQPSPHPKHLGCLVCANCGKKTGLKQRQYKEVRKMYNLKHHLVKVVARLDRASLGLIESFRAEIPIYNGHTGIDYSRDYIVLAGSLTRETALDLRNRMRDTRFTFAVSGAVIIPVSNCRNGRYYVITLTASDPAMKSLLEIERERLCLLPQWPVSIILGAGSRKQNEKVKEDLNIRFNDNKGQSIIFSTMDVDILDYSGQSIIHHQEEALISVADEEEKEEGEITDKGHEQTVDTMVALETDCVGTSTTDHTSTQCETCNYIPHPTEIEAVVCGLCGHENNPCDSIVWYNDNRRHFLLDRKAVAISAKLDECSRALVASLFLKPLGNEIDCTALSVSCDNITLVEGLMEWSIQSSSPLLHGIQQTVQRSPALEIVGSHCIPTSDNDGESSSQRLVVIDVRPDPRLASVLFEASQRSLLAQYPMHVSCGLVPCGQVEAIAERINELVGQFLVLDATSVTGQPAS